MILDRYPARVEVKGSFTMFCACKIAFTSPFHPELWYPSFAEHEDSGQLARRISSIFDCISFPLRRPADRRDSGDLPLNHADPSLHEAAAADVSRSAPSALPQFSSASAMHSSSTRPLLGVDGIRPRPSSSPASKAPPPQRRPRTRRSPAARQVRPRTL